ncbi:SCP2 sterol-binding domain-containing protein [Roseovarius ramblicola]|uniref:SCP2 sterol-binding domain-containing protein n=1 Tax=Roseovarius ramblicola TaxID=2022336 RepID=A0ABV5I2K4_9RHOB
MTPLIADYVATLGPRAAGRIRGRARLEIADHGSVLLSETGAAPGAPGAEADVVLAASDAVFRAILAGAQNPVTAYMTGKLRVEGNVQRALKVSGILTGS